MQKSNLNKKLAIVKEVLRQGRLHVLPLVFATIIAGAASTSSLTLELVAQSFFISILINFVASAPNDYFDRNMDSNIKRKQITGTYVTNKTIGKYVATLSIILSLLTSLYLNSFAGLSVLAITVLSLLYSMPPFRFKGRAPLDSIVNGVVVFLIFGLGVALSGGTFSDIIPGAYWFSLIMMGAHAITAIPDMKQDKKAGLRTTPMILGKNGTIAITQLIILAALYFENFSPLTASFLISLFLVLFVFWKDWSEIRLVYLMGGGIIYCAIYLFIYAITRGLI